MRGNVAPGTAEKGRKQYNELAHRILEKLQAQKYFGSKFLNTGLKSMTCKQLIFTIAFFMKFICGNSRGTRVPSEKITIEDVNKFLTEIGYPYLQTKSWMKTPNAPHAYNHLIDLLFWLCDFISEDESINWQMFELEENLTDVDNCFPNSAYTHLFLATIRDNFIYWNNQQNNEFEESKSKLVDEFIYLRKGIQSKEQIEKDIERLKKEYDNQLKKRFVVKQAKKLEEQLKVQEQLERELDRLKHITSEKNDLKNELNIKFQDQRDKQQELFASRSSLENTVLQQAMSLKQRDEFIVELKKQKQIIELKKTSINHLKDIGISNQVLDARKRTKQIDLISKLNGFVHELFQKLGTADYYNTNVQNLCFHQTDLDSMDIQFQRIESLFETIKEKNLSDTEMHVCKFNKLSEQLKQLQLVDITQLSYENETLLNEESALKMKTTSINATRMDKEKTFQDDLIRLRKQSKELKTGIAEKEKQIDKRKEIMANLQETTKKRVCDTETESKVLIMAKKKILLEKEAMHEQLKIGIAKLDSLLESIKKF